MKDMEVAGCGVWAGSEGGGARMDEQRRGGGWDDVGL